MSCVLTPGPNKHGYILKIHPLESIFGTCAQRCLSVHWLGFIIPRSGPGWQIFCFLFLEGGTLRQPWPCFKFTQESRLCWRESETLSRIQGAKFSKCPCCGGDAVAGVAGVACPSISNLQGDVPTFYILSVFRTRESRTISSAAWCLLYLSVCTKENLSRTVHKSFKMK